PVQGGRSVTADFLGHRAPFPIGAYVLAAALGCPVYTMACLHEGVVADADLLDAGVIFGTGFAPFRGGPVQHIRAVGADAIVERLKALQQHHGDR
ncbi:hypothetical protein, partial [Mesorhizobium sp. M8A.F.Ca.ET.182.01.1.1]|uniref:hypothetical protein n=1 Tax=Mesorhizobium sp. M8A.F.Ca.ET.182.01.1.1 TaxID=2563964 RepID=UPI001AEE6937